MQTFLPYPDFQMCAKVLDRQRLGKQRIEALQIFKVIHGQKQGWSNHPAVLMWAGYETSLRQYYNAMVTEWKRRGYLNRMPLYTDSMELLCKRPPPWLGDPAFHASHQSNLIRKLPEHYRPIFGNRLPDNLPYVWPARALADPEFADGESVFILGSRGKDISRFRVTRSQLEGANVRIRKYLLERVDKTTSCSFGKRAGWFIAEDLWSEEAAVAMRLML